MAYFNIVKANARITELETANAALASQVAELSANEPEALKVLQAELDGANAKLSKLTETEAALLAVTAERDQLKAGADSLKKSVDAEAAAKAASIVASQGAKTPVAAEKSNGPAANREELTAQLAAITDPSKRCAFIKANSSALFTPKTHSLKQ